MPTRRSFIKQLAFGTEEILRNPNGNTLVCVFLRGGADTLNMIVPYASDEYYKARPTIGIPAPGTGEKAGLKLDDRYAFHPKMKTMLPIFQDGRLAVIQNVGSDNTSGSHFEAQDQMEHGEAYKKTIGSGWLGRHLRSCCDAASPLSAIAIGALMPESLRGAPSVSVLRSIDDIKIKAPSGQSAAVAKALSQMYQAETGLLALQGKTTLELLSKIEKVRSKPYRASGKFEYPKDELGSGLREIARLIKADVGLEIACIDANGWDTHFVQGDSEGLQAGLIEQLSAGIAAFDADIAKYRNRVTILIMTEFGRRIQENVSLGTDHGRGFAAMLIGDQIDGGKVHGAFPDLVEVDRLNFLGPAGLKIHYDYRNVFADVLCGLMGNKDISGVFPDLVRKPVGVLKHNQLY